MRLVIVARRNKVTPEDLIDCNQHYDVHLWPPRLEAYVASLCDFIATDWLNLNGIGQTLQRHLGSALLNPLGTGYYYNPWFGPWTRPFSTDQLSSRVIYTKTTKAATYMTGANATTGYIVLLLKEDVQTALMQSFRSAWQKHPKLSPSSVHGHAILPSCSSPCGSIKIAVRPSDASAMTYFSKSRLCSQSMLESMAGRYTLMIWIL